MDIIPGVDLLDNKCVCPVHRAFADEVSFSSDPGEMARMWVSQGARRLYLADLEGARTGAPRNLRAVREIIEATGIPVDLGGGIRSIEAAENAFDMGVDRIVVGTSAALEDNFAENIFRSSYAEKVILSVASLNGFVAVRDWQARTDERAEAFARRMCDLGARRLVFTDVTRKGMHGGVNVIAVKRMAQSLNVPIIASGGVSSLDDINKLKELEPIGVEGVVVVTAIYQGSIRLADAIAIGNAQREAL